MTASTSDHNSDLRRAVSALRLISKDRDEWREIAEHALNVLEASHEREATNIRTIREVLGALDYQQQEIVALKKRLDESSPPC